MANNDILQYLRKTPHNTNVNVVKGMIGNESGGGAIEMTTVFDEDITLTFEQPQYLPPRGAYLSNITVNVSEVFLKITYDNDIILYGYADESKNFNITKSTESIDIDIAQNTSNTTYSGPIIYVNYGSSDEEVQTYCQTPHHLKIEYFTI